MLNGLILAAGAGRRMGEVTKNHPKSLLMYQNKTLLERIIDNFMAINISSLGIVRGYQKELLIHSKITHYFENSLWASTNILTSLLSASDFLSASDTIISYADIFYAKEALMLLADAEFDIVLTSNINFLSTWQLRFENIYSDLESFKFDDAFVLKEIGRSVSDLSDVQGQYMGLFKIKQSVWPIILEKLYFHLTEEKIAQLDMTSFFQFLIEQGFKIHVIPYNDIWGEMDTPLDVELYTQDTSKC